MWLAHRGFIVDAVDRIHYPELEEHPNLRFHEKDIEDFPLPEETYRLIIASQVLQFFPRSRRSLLLGGMAKALEPGGMLIASSFTDGDQFLEVARVEEWEAAEQLSFRAPDGGWISFFERGELRSTISACGLQLLHYSEFTEQSTNRSGMPHRFGLVELVAKRLG